MMKKNSIITLLALVLYSGSVFGQELEPLDLAKKIFSKEDFPHLNEFIIGEYKGEPNGQHLPDNSNLYFKLLGEKGTHAVVNMTILDSLGKGVDTYLHFKKDGIWKMSAFRSLAMSGFIEQMVVEMENTPQEELDEMIQNAQKMGDSIDVPFRNKEEFNTLLNNAKLTIELDDNIVKHFETNRSEFDRLKELALEELSQTEINSERTTSLLKDQADSCKKLLITGIYFRDYLVGGNVLSFSIGGMVDNTVGYLYARDEKDLPEMNPSRLIMLREIGDGWYLYKTT